MAEKERTDGELLEQVLRNTVTQTRKQFVRIIEEWKDSGLGVDQLLTQIKTARIELDINVEASSGD